MYILNVVNKERKARFIGHETTTGLETGNKAQSNNKYKTFQRRHTPVYINH